MKHIEKFSKEPESFSNWKRKNKNAKYEELWEEENSQIYNDLKKTLLDEQGSICCYCNISIESIKHSSHIEHIKPKDTFPNVQLDYSNLLVSCNGSNHQHCGKKKDKWYNQDLFISPLDPEWEKKFQFEELSGKIKPTNENKPSATTTIQKLGLDSKILNAYRKKAIESFNYSTQEGINLYFQKSDGKFISFWSCLKNVFKDYINE